MTENTAPTRPAKGNAKSGGGRPAKSAEEKALLDNETKEDRFVRLAKARMPKALKSIKLLEALSNKSQYGYTEAQTKQIVDALTRAVISVRDKFANVKEAKDTSFDFVS